MLATFAVHRWAEYLNIALTCATGVVLIGLQLPLGWALLLLSGATLLLCSKEYAKELFLVYIGLAILGTTDINTNISYSHMLQMGTALFLAVAIPYVISRYMYQDYLVRFRFHHGRRWFGSEIALIALSGILAYLILPFYLESTGAYMNWSVEPGASLISRLFIGTNALGIWDEFFFISVVFGIFRRHFTFWVANLAQAVLFTSFLFELGFTGWGPLMIYPFALMQGYIFFKTESLFYVITIHLTIDFMLFLALIHAHHPDWIQIFLT